MTVNDNFVVCSKSTFGVTETRVISAVQGNDLEREGIVAAITTH